MTDNDARAPGRLSLHAKLAAITEALQASGEPCEERRETSMAWVFLTDAHVYKIKKPIRRRIFDFRTLARRHHACREELRLNRRLAPDVYLGLTRLTRSQDGTLTLDGAGETVDWLVRMRRLPARRFLDQAIMAGELHETDIATAMSRLTRFHAACRPASIAAPAYIARYRDELVDIRGLLAGAPFADFAARFSRLCDRLESVLNDNTAGLMARLEGGRVVEGHGDLRPEHVWLGPPVLIIDCLEADAIYRALDPFEEYAALAMECAVLGADWVAPLVHAHATDGLGDDPGPRLGAFYTAFRGTLRARQALAHLHDPAPRTPKKWRPQAERYLTRAEAAAATLESAEAR